MSNEMIIGREDELNKLRSAVDSNRSSFIAVYGRRRIGKTFLIREAFDYTFTFQHAGVYGGRREDELFAFNSSLKDSGLVDTEIPQNWLQAFELLKDLIRESRDKKKVIFIDELSWMDTPKSDLIMALENFWNGWASTRKDIILIVCSSVTSWMLNKVIHNKGGLYNRLTLKMELYPFSLKQCEQYAKASGLEMTRYQLMEAYMILGGVPYYWSLFEKGLSLSQNIDNLFFSKQAKLEDEFNHLFSSLFRYPDEYIEIVKALSCRQIGLTREQILAETGITGSGAFSSKLEELERSGFIRGYQGYKKKKKDILYQLMDPYVIFYYHFLDKGRKDEHYWTKQLNTSTRNVWNGIAFERVCLWHIYEIKKALGISGVLSDVCSWSCKENAEKGIEGSQIDLLIDRGDHVINILEMKFASSPYAITKKVDGDLRRKKNDFLLATRTNASVHLTMVTPYGIVRNSYSGNVQSEVKGDDLFC